MAKLTASVVIEYQKKWKKSNHTADAFKSIGQELAEKCSLSDREAIDVINNHNVLDILASKEQEEERKIERVKDRCNEESNESTGKEGFEWNDGYEAGKYRVAGDILEILEVI